ncbi:MAG: aldehyde dehydrogenase family protein [Actinomycetota bacterium]
MTLAATTPVALHRTIEDLASRKHLWAAASIEERLELLESIRRRADFAAARWVDAAADAKGYPRESNIASEDWLSGPYALLSAVTSLTMSLRRLSQGKTTYRRRWVRSGADGRAIVRVMPVEWWEPLLLSGYSLDVWMEPQVTPANLAENTASFYRRQGDGWSTPNRASSGQICAVLGAGNISSIPVLDTLYKLYAEGQVVALKLSPINDYLGPIFNEIFVDFVDRGYLRILYGGGEVGEQLVHHPLVESVHITGSAQTHDRIVWGEGVEAADRKRRHAPHLNKPITSELGGVSPVIVVPGPWSKADFRFQAEHFATQKLVNGGFNCIAAQVLVLPGDWVGSDRFLREVSAVFDRLPRRHPYYPEGEERRFAIACQPGAVTVGDSTCSWVPDLDPTAQHSAYREEFFSAAFATTRLPHGHPAEFLPAAVEFCNRRLVGTLGANLIIHPATIRQLGRRFDEAIADLRYGAIAINVWTGFNFLQQRASWTAFPGHNLDDIGSGMGVVHNTLLFDRPQKTVSRGPFAPVARALGKGEFHFSPTPVWFLNNRTGAATSRLFTRFAADHSVRHLPRLFTSALSG